MTALSERRISRREFGLSAIGTLLIPTLSACRTAPIPEALPTPTKEKEIGPQEGDVVVTADSSYLIRNGKKYRIPDLSEYKRLTKFDKYKRKLFTGQFDLSIFPPGEVPKEKYIIDPFSGQLKDNKPFGGELNIYFSGFLSDGGIPYNPLIPKQDALTSLRKRLEKKKWTDDESLHFNYGRKGFEEYGPSDTARNPVENNVYAIEQVVEIKRKWPLVQINAICNSLGVLFGIAAAKKHPDVFNNLILFSGPVRGLKHETCRSQGITAAREILMRFGIIEQVTDYLFGLWKDKTYQRELDEFVESFKKSGKNIRSYVSDADSIVFSDEAYLPGVTTVLQAGEKKGCLQRIVSLPQILKEHARVHEDPDVQKEVAEMIGENLAA